MEGEEQSPLRAPSASRPRGRPWEDTGRRLPPPGTPDARSSAPAQRPAPLHPPSVVLTPPQARNPKLYPHDPSSPDPWGTVWGQAAVPYAGY